MTKSLLLLLTAVFVFGLTGAVRAQKNEYNVIYKNPAAVLGASTAKIFDTDKGDNVTFYDPYQKKFKTYFAGTFNGEVDGTGTSFFCIDFLHPLAVYGSGGHTYTDEGNTSSQITYILNNYYPYNQLPYSGALAEAQEAAAVQMAIWFFSDGVDASTVQSSQIKNRALAIIADANANAGSITPVETLLITPSTQSVMEGSSAAVVVSAYDINGNPAAGVNIKLTTTSGGLSAAQVTTGSNGISPVVYLTKGSGASAVISAEAVVTIPHGTKYVHSSKPNNYQKIVLATPVLANLSVDASAEWYAPAECDLNGYVTFTQGGWGSPNNSGPGQIREANFSTVFPQGLIIGEGSSTVKLTSSAAVKSFLPQGGTAGKLTGNLVNPTSTSAGVLAGQVTALTLNVYFDSAGVIGPNPQKLGRLIIGSGPFYGKTVYELLDIANSALGGASTGYTYSQINDAATKVNENFVEGKTNKGYLECGIEYASIGDKVWEDVNKNGIQDNGEICIPGVVVNLYNCTGVKLQSTTTDNNGKYLFGNLVPGEYFVEFELPNGYAFTKKNEGNDAAKDSDADVNTGRTVCTTLTPGEDDLSWDAGMFNEAACVENWTGNLGSNETLCEYNPKWITAAASVSLTPNPSRATVQTAWRIVSPADMDNSYNYNSFEITKDTSFSIAAYWPGIRAADTLVKVEFSINVLDCDGNTIHAAVTKNVFWNSSVCPPPAPEEADLEIIKTADKENVQNGENVTYTITVINHGPKDAADVSVTDILPGSLEFVSASASKGSYDNVSGLWMIGDLANGASVQLHITVKAEISGTGSSTVDLGPAADYNLFVLHDLKQPSADTEGRIAVGRNASLANYSVGDKLPPAPYGERDVLVVGNNLTYASGGVFGGNVVYGNSSNLPIYPVSVLDGSVRKESVIDFEAAESYLKNLSVTLSSYPINSITEYIYGGIYLTGSNPVLNIFNIDGAKLSAANDVQIHVPNGAAVLVNISGDSVSWKGGNSINGTTLQSVIYNFFEAEYLKIHLIDVRGSVLAPTAMLDFPTGVITGQTMVMSMEGAGQFNDKPFNGNIPVDTTIVNISSIAGSMPLDPNSANNSSMFAVHVGGFQNTADEDGVNRWAYMGAPQNNAIVMALENDNAGNIISGTLGGNIYQSADNGATWNQMNEGMENSFVWALQTSGNNILAATEKGIYITEDNGSVWNESQLFDKEVRTLVKDGSGNLYAGTWGFGVYKSEDGGATWKIANGGLTSPEIQTLTVSANGTLYAGSYDGGLFRSMDAGQNWVKLKVGYDNIWSVGVTSDNRVFAGTYGGGLYRSIDNGDSWVKVSGQLKERYIHTIKVDAADNIYLSSWSGGIYVSNDKGSNWKRTGMSGFEVSSLIMDNAGRELLAGTAKGSIYRMTDGVSSAAEENAVPESFELQQNYPNPFNPNTKIEFSVAASEQVTINVYNLLGQQVAQLTNQVYTPGKYTVQFEGSGLASGIYIYQMKSPSSNIVKKMMLLK